MPKQIHNVRVTWRVRKNVHGNERKMAESWCRFRNKCANDNDYTYRFYSVMKHAPKELTKMLDTYLYMEKEVTE